jgi:hypothetical protein
MGVPVFSEFHPDRHGIIHNEVFQINPDAPKLDNAESHGLSTASISWPVMGSAAVDYLIAELWGPSPEADPSPFFAQANSEVVAHIFKHNKYLLD